ncbi:MAG: hypothetical protein AB7O66_04080 [Limisphaerales bacterium]
MIFTLEALKAAYGDALLLHFGPTKAPNLAIIDGGPSGIYQSVLKPRLAELMKNKKRLKSGRLPIRLVMVSHIDDDHVNGILAMANELADSPGKQPYRIESLWHNSFDDLLGNSGEELAASLATAVRQVLVSGKLPAGSPLREVHTGLVIASVKQGRELRQAATRLGWDINKEFGGKLVRAGKKGTPPIPMDPKGGMTLRVLGPQEARLNALRKEWDKQLNKMGLARNAAQAAEYADRSVFNLSSLVVLAEAPGSDGGKTRRMLLTGDARGDHVLDGLKAAGLLKGGKCHVDLLKLPHHGSNRNLEPEFFAAVTADHYIVSSNGEKFDNPDRETLDWLVAARQGGGPFTIHLTYPVEEFQFKKRKTIRKELKALIDAGENTGAYRVICREPGAPSVRVDLGDPLTE